MILDDRWQYLSAEVETNVKGIQKLYLIGWAESDSDDARNWVVADGDGNIAIVYKPFVTGVWLFRARDTRAKFSSYLYLNMDEALDDLVAEYEMLEPRDES